MDVANQYKIGQRIRLVRMDNDPDPIPSGSEGVITHISNFKDWAQISVNWDNGRMLMVCLPEDVIMVVGGSK